MDKERVLKEIDEQDVSEIAQLRTEEFLEEYWGRINQKESQPDEEILTEDLSDLPTIIDRSYQAVDDDILPQLNGSENIHDILHHTDHVYEKIDPVVRELRQNLFGQENPKFISFHKAIRWIQKKTAKNTRTDDEFLHEVLKEKIDGALDDLESAREDLNDALEEYEREFQEVNCQFVPNKIQYVSLTKDDVQQSEIHRASPLMDLAAFQQKYSRITGLTKPSLYFYMAMGVKSVIPRWRLEAVEPEGGLMTQFHLKTYYPNTSLEDMKKAYDKIRGYRKCENPRFIKEKDRILLGVIEAEGGIPSSGKDEFWEKIFERCREEGITDWGSAGVARSRWSRLKKKLDDLEQSDRAKSIGPPE
jgi:hypothetical protein